METGTGREQSGRTHEKRVSFDLTQNLLFELAQEAYDGDMGGRSCCHSQFMDIPCQKADSKEACKAGRTGGVTFLEHNAQFRGGEYPPEAQRAGGGPEVHGGADYLRPKEAPFADVEIVIDTLDRAMLLAGQDAGDAGDTGPADEAGLRSLPRVRDNPFILKDRAARRNKPV